MIADASAKPTVRNPLSTFMVPIICFALAPPLGNFLGTTMFRFAPTAAIIAGLLIFMFHASQMVRELNAASGGAFVWWHLLIPIYGLYLAATAVPAQMAKAKQEQGKPPPRGALAYLFLFLYVFAADLNDLASGGSDQQAP